MQTDARDPIQSVAATYVPVGGSLRRHKGTGEGWCCVLFGFGFLVLKPVKRGRPLLKLDRLAAPRRCSVPSWRSQRHTPWGPGDGDSGNNSDGNRASSSQRLCRGTSAPFP